MSRRLATSIAVVMTLLVFALIPSCNYYLHYHRSKEIGAFRDLAELTKEMIREGGDGVGERDGRGYITSFDKFYDFVRLRRPRDTAQRDAGNPFPGILPSSNYRRLETTATSSNETLIVNDSLVYKYLSRGRVEITCGGDVRFLPEDR